MINIHSNILNQGLTAGEFYAFCHILKRINMEGTCYPSKQLLKRETKLGRETLAKSIKGLVDKKIISRKQAKGEDGKFSKTIYTILVDGCGVFLGGKGKEVGFEEDVSDKNRSTKSRNTASRTTGDRNTGFRPLSIEQYEVLENISIEQLEGFLKEKKSKNLNQNAKTSQQPKDQKESKKEKKGCAQKKESELAKTLNSSKRLQNTILTHLEENPEDLKMIKERALYKGDIGEILIKWCDYHHNNHKAKQNPLSFFGNTFPTWLINAKSKNRGGGKKNSPQLGAAKPDSYYANLDKSKIGF